MTTLAPLTAGMPKLSAAWPERKLTMPILKVSWACAPDARKHAASIVDFSATERHVFSAPCCCRGIAFSPAREGVGLSCVESVRWEFDLRPTRWNTQKPERTNG